MLAACCAILGPASENADAHCIFTATSRRPAVEEALNLTLMLSPALTAIEPVPEAVLPPAGRVHCRGASFILNGLPGAFLLRVKVSDDAAGLLLATLIAVIVPAAGMSVITLFSVVFRAFPVKPM